MRSVIVKIREAALDEGGKWLLNVVRSQNPHLSQLLTPRDGIVYAEINDEDTEDVLRVKVDDTLGYAARMAKHGGTPTEPPELAEKKERMFGSHAMTVSTRRNWWIPQRLIHSATRDPEQGAGIINEAAVELREFCTKGDFVVWRDPDWISQSEAAAIAGVPTTTINNAVRVGKLAIWDDISEPNPQRRTRVRQSEVILRWQNTN